jgi:hypothetical protein
MESAILLAVAACLYTAVSWVCQRIGATSSPATSLDAGPAAAARTALVPVGQRRGQPGPAARMPDIRAGGIAP